MLGEGLIVQNMYLSRLGIQESFDVNLNHFKDTYDVNVCPVLADSTLVF